MPRAVKFDRYGGIDVLRVVEVDRPVPGPEQVIIRMKAADINPGEAAIREGAFAKQWMATIRRQVRLGALVRDGHFAPGFVKPPRLSLLAPKRGSPAALTHRHP